MSTPERLDVVLQKLSEYRHEMMMSQDYRADFVPTMSDMLKEPKVLWAYELVSSLTTKIEFITELLKTPDQISEQRLERVLRALFWHYDAIVPDGKLDEHRYYELLDSLNNRIEVVTQLLQIPRRRSTEVLMIITYYHSGVKNIASSYYPIVHKWINKSEGTLKTLSLPPDVLFENRKQGFEKRTGSLSGIDGGREQGFEKRTGSLSGIDGGREQGFEKRTGSLPEIDGGREQGFEKRTGSLPEIDGGREQGFERRTGSLPGIDSAVDGLD
jgi:hypothetical protein